MTFYHVTERDIAADILKEGFLGGWGDVGFGVYLYGNLPEALNYALKGGWDGELQDPVILAVDDPHIGLVIPEPSWPNPEDYLDVHWHEMDDDEEDALWVPQHLELLDTL